MFACACEWVLGVCVNFIICHGLKKISLVPLYAKGRNKEYLPVNSVYSNYW